MDDIWQCRHSREGCATDEECLSQDRAYQPSGVTPLGQCIAEQYWPGDDDDDAAGYEAYCRDMDNLKPWNEGIK